MYEAFYRLTDQPFRLTPDPKFLYMSESHKEGLGHLLYGVERRRGIIALTGESGMGKTTLINALIQKIGKRTHIAHLYDPMVSPHDMYMYLLNKFGLDVENYNKGGLLVALQNLLLQFSELGEDCLFIVDDAQHLSDDVLEQIRLMSNFETHTEKLIQIVLVGTQLLQKKIHTDEFASLRQRVGVVYNLRPFSRDETASYIMQRLALCGASGTLLTPDAMVAVHHFSGGVPRVINVICDLALFLGFSELRGEIGSDMIAGAAADLQMYTAVDSISGSVGRWGSYRDDRADQIVAMRAREENELSFGRIGKDDRRRSAVEIVFGRWRWVALLLVIAALVAIVVFKEFERLIPPT